MARQNFLVFTDNTPSIDGIFAVDLMLQPGSNPIQNGPHEYFVNGRSLPTTNPSWDGTTVSWTVNIKGKTYNFTGHFSSGGDPFAGHVAWVDPEEGQDSWSAGVGEPGDESEERSVSA
jgi:hypothetical protein